MVIGLLAIAAIPTVTGVGNAVSAQKRQNESMSKEQEKFHLTFMLRQNGKIEEAGQGVLVDKKVSHHSPLFPFYVSVIDAHDIRCISTSQTHQFKATDSWDGSSSTQAKKDIWGW
jgi:hypothetical protein